MIYIVIFALLMFCIWYYDVQKNFRYKEISYWTIFAIFFLVSGLRYKIGIDSLMYMSLWSQYGDMWDFHWFDDIVKFQQRSDYVSRFQPGWVLYCIILRGFSHDYTIVQIVTSLLFNVALFKVIKKYSKTPFLTLLIFYMNFTFIELEFEVMRETVAVSIFLLCSFDAWINKKWVKFYIWTFVAFMMHTSAIIMFALPLLRNINWSLLKLSLIIVLPGFLLGIAGRIILGDLLNAFLGGDDFISQYTASAFEKDNNFNYLLMYGFKPTLLYIFAAWGFKRFRQKELIPLVFLTISFMYMGMFYFTASRLMNYIIVIVLIAVTPLIQDLIVKFRTMWIVPLLLIIYSIPFIYQLTEPRNLARYYPYQWVIDPHQTQLQKKLEL